MLFFRLSLFLVFTVSTMPIIMRFFRRKEFDFWDIMIFFSAYFYCAIPAIKLGDSSLKFNVIHYDSATALLYFFIIFTFLSGLYIVRNYYKKRWGNNANDIINISLFIRKSNPLKINNLIYLIISIVLFVGITYYIPMTSMFAKLKDAENILKVNYGHKAAITVISKLFTITYAFALFCYFKVKDSANKRLLKVFAILFILESIFLPRRYLVYNLLIAGLMFYSVRREQITKTFYTKAFVGIMLLWMFYFPFYNVMRHTALTFNPQNPIESLYGFIEDSYERWGESVDEARESSESRSLGIFYTMWQLEKNDITPGYGKAFFSELEYSIPKILHPNKGNGIEKEIEKRSKINVDCADTWLLYAYSDAHMLGGFACVLFVVFTVLLLKFEIAISNKIIGQSYFPIFIISTLISYAWNVEDGYASVFTSIITIYIPILYFYIIRKGKLALPIKTTFTKNHKK